MDWVNILFWIFASVAGAAALAVISVRNPVYSVLFLILTFFSVACTWLLVGAEFLGVTLVLVYVGAVMVLFLFVVLAVLVYSIRTIRAARANPQRSDRESAYVALRPEQVQP